MSKTRANEALILKIAKLYYEGGFTQDLIAKKYGFSRPTIVRILQQARDEGIVQIRITKALPDSTRLESLIEDKFFEFGVREVIVIDGEGRDGKTSVARAAAEYLDRTLRAKDVLGLGWSTTLLHLPDYIKQVRYSPECVVQLGGGISLPESGNTQEIAFRLGRNLGAPVRSINAPVLVKNKAVREGLLEDPSIRNTSEWAEKSTIAIIGLGVADPSSTLVKTGYLEKADVQTIARKGAVGDMLSQYFDIDGQELSMPWSDRLITHEFDKIKAINNTVLVAAGSPKTAALIGAMRSGVVNTVIVDKDLADGVIEFMKK